MVSFLALPHHMTTSGHMLTTWADPGTAAPHWLLSGTPISGGIRPEFHENPADVRRSPAGVQPESGEVQPESGEVKRDSGRGPTFRTGQNVGRAAGRAE